MAELVDAPDSKNDSQIDYLFASIPWRLSGDFYFFYPNYSHDKNKLRK